MPPNLEIRLLRASTPPFWTDDSPYATSLNWFCLNKAVTRLTKEAFDPREHHCGKPVE